MKKLPVDVHDFKDMITGDHVYVDKTQYIHKMVTEGTYYFLSRPRRFGKTLLVSTLELAQQDFSVYDLDDLALEPLLFQTGYVTIKDRQGELYHLGYPNQEVKNSLERRITEWRVEEVIES